MTVTAVLFAGGLSRRMGADKSRIEVGGEPLWRRQVRVLRESAPESLLVSARSRPDWCPPEIAAVADLPPERGPLSGLAAALDRARTTHVLALAVDLPRMGAGHLRRLRSLGSPGCGVIPTDRGRLEPLCALYPAGAAGLAKAALSRGDAALHALARDLLLRGLARPYPLAADERALYLNLNAPSDVARLGVSAAS